VRAIELQLESASPPDFLTKLGVQIAGAWDDETVGMTRITFAEAHRFPVLRRLYREVTGRAIQAIARGLHHWRSLRLIDFDGDAELLATIAFGMMTDGARIRSVLGEPMSRAEVDRHVNAAVALFLRGMHFDAQASA